MSSPSISLAMIIKNERKNLPRLLQSVKGCFDEIHITDTGSDDGSVEYLQSKEAHDLCQSSIFVHHFKWTNSFCEARNFSFSHVKTDYVMWMDGDDILDNQEGFINWKKTAMEFADMWVATYHYAVDKELKPIISFIRERVFKVSNHPRWQYDLHEGIIPNPKWQNDYAISWSIKHLRDNEDINQDKSRNIKILEKIRDTKGLDGRLKFYYGKELYENGRAQEAIAVFDDALKSDLQIHDKLLSYQYGSYACLVCADQIKDEFPQQKEVFYQKALKYCHDGLIIDPNRAEFHASIGDIWVKKQDFLKAIPYYSAAKNCFNQQRNGSPYEGAIYSFVDCYGLNPTLQLAKIYFNLGKLDESLKEAKEALEKYNNPDAKLMIEELDRIKSLTNLDNNQQEVDEIVFTCPPQTAYEFDEDLYAVKGMGGSETALIEVAKWLKIKTGKPVKVFNMRANDLVSRSGVEYISAIKVNEYFSKFRPKVHIAWRHNIKLTKAKTYLWCHDLITQNVEAQHNFDKIMCLTEFHKNYVKAKQNVPDSKIWLTRNGIDPNKFNFSRKQKNPNKIVWMSSPDRGLEQAMLVCDEVRKTHPEIELHVYYGLDNLYKFGMKDLAEKLKSMMYERPWVKYHGFTEQSKMYQDVSDAVIWCHPCNFIESFCITALEMLELGIYPITRSLGALKNTLSEASSQGMATILEHDCFTPERVMNYANAVREAIDQKKWEKISFDKSKYSWESVADEWIEEMRISA